MDTADEQLVAPDLVKDGAKAWADPGRSSGVAEEFAEPVVVRNVAEVCADPGRLNTGQEQFVAPYLVEGCVEEVRFAKRCEV